MLHTYMVTDCIAYYRVVIHHALQEAVDNKISAAVWTFINKHKVDISHYDEVRYLS